MLLYTDGISEMMDASEEQFGEERLRLFLESHPDCPATHFADTLLETMSRWSGRPSGQDPDDDVTLLAVHFQSVEGRQLDRTIAEAASI